MEYDIKEIIMEFDYNRYVPENDWDSNKIDKFIET